MKHYLVYDALTGTPIAYQELMTLQQAVDRLNREVASCRYCGLDISDRDYQIVDTSTGNIIL